MRTIPQTDRYLCDRVLTGSATAAVRFADCARSPCPNATGSKADLGTKWEQDWQYQPNAATMYVRQGSIVTALQSKPLSITATCFQYHEYGRRTGLKIRSSQEGVVVQHEHGHGGGRPARRRRAGPGRPGDRDTNWRLSVQVFGDGRGGCGPSDQQGRSCYDYDADHDSIQFTSCRFQAQI